MARPLSVRVATLVGAAASLLLAGPAVADDPPAPPPPPPSAAPPRPPPPPAVPRGKAAAPAPRPPPRPPRRPPTRGKRVVEVAPPAGTPIASAPEFSRFEDGTSRIWVEVSRKVDVTESKPQGRLVYRLRGTAVVQRTNQLPLLTGFFSTPVERAQLVANGPDVDLVIDLREPSASAYHVIETPRGMVLRVDFPKASVPAAADDNAPVRAGGKRSHTISGGPQGDAPAPVPMDSN